MLQITEKTSPEEISDYIKVVREQKGKERETLALIDKALVYGHDFVINLFWEQALTYQHLYMNNQTNREPINKMEQAVLTAKFYIEKYKLIKWRSRLFRFLGRISDYRGEYAKSVNFYKKSVIFSKDDPEPFRVLELDGLLSYALIMSGKIGLGYRKAKESFKDFELTEIGKILEKKDYATWAIWRSGITMRTVEAFINKKLNFNKKEFENWILDAEEDLSKGDFSYRKFELKNIKQKLQEN